MTPIPTERVVAQSPENSITLPGVGSIRDDDLAIADRCTSILSELDSPGKPIREANMDNGKIVLPPPPATSDNRAWARECLRILDAEIEPREAEIVRLTQEIQPFRAMRETFLRLLENAPAEDSPAPAHAAAAADDHEAAPTPTPGRSRRTQVAEDTDLSGLDRVEGLGDAEGVYQQLVCIARAAPNRLLNVTQVSRLLLHLGATTTPNLHSVRVSTQRALNAHPDLFELVRPATYRYTGDDAHGGQEAMGPDLAHSDQETEI